MRFHVLGLPHTSFSELDVGCAYTQKLVKFAKMMMSLGHEVFLYGNLPNESPCTEFVICGTRPEKDPNDIYDLSWLPNEPMWMDFNAACIAEIGKRKGPQDFICTVGGTAQEPVANAFPHPGTQTVEIGIGYKGTFAKYRVFESYAWLHFIHGHQQRDIVSWYDAVIPNYFDLADFPLSPPEPEGGGYPGQYLFWVGRYIANKGPHIALDIARATGKHLIMAGQGAHYEGTRLVGSELTLDGEGFTHIGPVNKAERAFWMANAYATLVPTQYLGPFEGVAVESMLCGTPVVVPDFGCFTEYVVPWLNGFRFRTLGEAVMGVRHLDTINRTTVRSLAMRNFSLEAVALRYQEYFERLLGLWGQGWTDTSGSRPPAHYGLIR